MAVRRVTRTIEEDTDSRIAAEYYDDGAPSLGERIVYLVGGILITLLAFRVLLSLLGANRGNFFADFIYNVTYPFVAPFFGLFGYDVQYGVSRLEVETIFAIVVYSVLMVLVARVFSMGRPANHQVHTTRR